MLLVGITFEEHNVALLILYFSIPIISSLSVYGILLGGWASNSRYAFLGALRSASQMLSYELVLSLLVLLVCILAQSFNFIDIVNLQTNTWFIIPLLPFIIVYFIAILAETNRTPFDLPEAEAELVAGYSVEYSGGPFAFYFIAEYCNLIIWSFTTTILFLGGWLPHAETYSLISFIFFSLKSAFILSLFCCIRAALPRYRWDQLMFLAWRAFLPIVLLGCFFLYLFLCYSTYYVTKDLLTSKQFLYTSLGPVKETQESFFDTKIDFQDVFKTMYEQPEKPELADVPADQDNSTSSLPRKIVKVVVIASGVVIVVYLIYEHGPAIWGWVCSWFSDVTDIPPQELTGVDELQVQQIMNWLRVFDLPATTPQAKTIITDLMQEAERNTPQLVDIAIGRLAEAGEVAVVAQGVI